MINYSLLGLEPSDLNKMAMECFASVMRYMGDMPLLKNQHEVDCVNTIFVYCRQFEPIRDEVYCQIMKQLTDNRNRLSEERGWELMWLATGLFACSQGLMKELTAFQRTRRHPIALDSIQVRHGIS